MNYPTAAGLVRLLPLVHGPVHHNAFAALGTGKLFDCRECREGIQSAAMRAASAWDRSRYHLQHDRGGAFHQHDADHRAAFVAGYVSLITAPFG